MTRQAPGPSGIGGWLLVLCALLIVFQPLSLSMSLLSLWPSIRIRGLPALLIAAARLLAAIAGIAGGMALLRRQPMGVALARVSLTAAAAIEIVMLLTPYFPGNRVPGDEPISAAWTLGYFGAWMTYLLRSRRVKNTFPA